MKQRTFPRYVQLCAIVLTGFSGFASVAGCDKGTSSTSATAATDPAKPAPSGGTGVVDLDAVADAVQWKSEIDKDLETVRLELGRRVTSFANEVADKVKQHKADLIESAKLNQQQAEDLNKNENLDKLPLSREQLNKLVLVLQNQQQYVRNVDQYASQLLQQRRAEIIQSYRNATKPIVLEVARQRGLTMVLLKNDSIFYSDPSVNITDDVIADVRKNTPKITFPSMPKMDLPVVNLGEKPQDPATEPATTPSATQPAR